MTSDFQEGVLFDRLPPIVQDKVIFQFMEGAKYNGYELSRVDAMSMAKEYYFVPNSTRMICKVDEAETL